MAIEATFQAAPPASWRRHAEAAKPRASKPKHGLSMAAGVDREPRMGDGCLHAFLDVGMNRGVHTRYLMEPHAFAGAQYLRWGFFEAAFGPSYGSDERVCAFGFEPNPAHAARLERLARL